MRWPNNADVVAIRQNAGNRSQFYLGVQKGKERTSGCGVHGGAGTVFVGCHYQLGNTDTYDTAEHVLTFGTVGILGGSDIQPGMTLAVGTLADPFLYGSARIRWVDPPNDRLYLEPNNLNAEGYLTTGDYIWVDGVYRLYRILPRIVAGVVYEDGNPDSAAPGWGLEYGIPFNGAGGAPFGYIDRPVALMGSPRFAWTGETIDFYGWRSFARGTFSIASYFWDFDGGVCPGLGVGHPGSPAHPIHVRWDAAGEYVASLAVTDDSGKAGNDFYGVPFNQHIAVRPVLVYDRPGEGDNPPYTNFEVNSLSGSYGSGWSLRVTVYGTADKSEFPDNALVILFAEDWYGGVQASRGGWYGQEGILFCGYIKADSVRVDHEKSTVSFEAQTIEQWASEIDCWPCNFEHVAGNPTRWHEYQNMTVEDILWFLAEQRSTLKNITDCFFCSDPDGAKALYFLDLTESSLYDQLSNQVGSCFFGKLSASRHGSVHLFKHKNMLDIAERTMYGPPVWAFSKQDWRDEIEVGEERMRDSVAQVDFIGFIYDANGNPQEVYSLSPANQTNFGRIEKVSGILLSGNTRGPGTVSEAEANALSGLYRAWKNIRFPHIRIPARNNRFLEPATLDYFSVILVAADTIRGYEWPGKEFLCTNVNYAINQENGYVLVDITGEASTWGPEGVGGDYLEGMPDVPDNPPEYFGLWPTAADAPAGQEAPPWSDADEWEPGGWQLEFDPVTIGDVYEMVYFNGDVFGFCYGGTGGGVWRRTPPNWTRTITNANNARGAVWNNRMFWGHAGGIGSAGIISSSVDGVNWVVDFNPGAGAYSAWSAMGGHGIYLYAGHRAFQGVAGTTFYRRDTVGNWVATPPNYAWENNYGWDIIGYGGYVYFSASAYDVYRYLAAWEAEPLLGGFGGVFFTVHEDTLYVSCYLSTGGVRVYRYSGGAWVKEFHTTDYGDNRAICVGGNGRLYLAVNDGTDSAVYVRTDSGDWALHSTAIAVGFCSVIADADGNLFAGTNSCEFWRYVPS